MKTSLLTVCLVSFSACATTKKGVATAPDDASLKRLAEVSEDCQNWKRLDDVPAGSRITEGFVKQDDKRIFVDTAKGFYVILSSEQSSDREASYIDQSDPETLFIANSSMINGFSSLQLRAQQRDESLADLIAASQVTLQKTALSTHWLLLLLQDRTKLIAPIRGQVCAKFPEARFIDCELGSFECAVNPVSEQSEASEVLGLNLVQGTKFCMRELGLTSANKLGPIAKACDHFRSSRYEENLRRVQEKAILCGPISQQSAEKLPSLKRVEDGCIELEAGFSELEKQH